MDCAGRNAQQTPIFCLLKRLIRVQRPVEREAIWEDILVGIARRWAKLWLSGREGILVATLTGYRRGLQ